MPVKLNFIPVEITLTKEQEAELFAEFQPVLHMASAACCNIAKAQDFTRFAYLAKALDLLLNAAYDSMVWPD
jgi:hypothetical protein